LFFGLLALARHPEFQKQLRAEIHSVLRTQSTSILYDNMPLLNAFIKVCPTAYESAHLIQPVQETLRLYPAASLQERVATRNTIIPLGNSIVTSTGEMMNEVMVRKGQVLSVAIASYHKCAIASSSLHIYLFLNPTETRVALG
jgi:cytochrome P450